MTLFYIALKIFFRDQFTPSEIISYRNMLVLLIRKSKEIHFKNFFLSNAKNIREVWKGIKNIIQVNNNKNYFPTCIVDNGLSITDPTLIADKFNSYFTSIANDIKSKIQSSHTNFYKYLKVPNAHSFFLSPTNSLEISELISKMSNHKASGPNSIPTFVLKHLNNEISSILSKLINLS